MEASARRLAAARILACRHAWAARDALTALQLAVSKVERRHFRSIRLVHGLVGEKHDGAFEKRVRSFDGKGPNEPQLRWPTDRGVRRVGQRHTPGAVLGGEAHHLTYIRAADEALPV
eukprot:jgi/Chrpa1/22346/Chrysochromulina_OHIO_Genome00001010-RA